MSGMLNTALMAASQQPVQGQASSNSTMAASSIGTNALQQLAGNFQNFLSLLTTQLQNQDPTAPMDTNQFTTELVQFTGVEAQEQSNTSLNSLISINQQDQVLQTANLNGKIATVTSDEIALQSGTGTIGFQSPAGGNVAFAIVDQNGMEIQGGTISAQSGANSWVWNGQNLAGSQMPDGAYRIALTTGTDAAPVTQSYNVIGTITGIAQTGTGTVLDIGALSLPMSAVNNIAGQ
jgi:flagellar basal-body rod modification protein FlgD